MAKNSREKELEDLIIYHKKLYYAGEPEISDAEYDALEVELHRINPQNPALYIVGTPEGGKIPHDPLMLSCKKAYELDEVMKWAKDIDYRAIHVGYKIDGLSLSLTYEDGKLIQAATRGNGSSGDDVTPNILYVKEIPKTIPNKNRVNVRGELYMRLSVFNGIMEKAPDKSYSSPRNLATGTLKQKESKLVAERPLSFKTWDLIGYDDSLTIEEQNKILQDWGFDTGDLYKIDPAEERTIEESYRKIEQERDQLDFEIDGVIYKYNLASDREAAGATEHHPKWQIAWKFSGEERVTTVESITWQVGRTSVLTPVAEVSPVTLAGAEIKRATLHNAEFVENLGLSIGDKVTIIRSGEVIPKIIGISEKSDNVAYSFPHSCPSCGSQTEREGVALMCTGKECRDQEIQSIRYWVNLVEIKGLGLKSIEKLYDQNIVTHFSDLYSPELTEELLVHHLGKNGNKIFTNISKTRNLDFHIFLAALGIPNLGKKQGKVLAKHFQSLDEIKQTSVDKLNSIEGISDTIANSILIGINDPNLTERIFLYDFSVKYPKKKSKTRSSSMSIDTFFGDEDYADDPVQEETVGKGRKIYITGSVSGYTKKELEQLITSHGFVWSKSVSRNLGLLVYGEKAGSAKLNKAREIGVEVISWQEFEKLINY